MCFFLAGRCLIPTWDINCTATELVSRVYFDSQTKTCKSRTACSSYGNGDYFDYNWECKNVCEALWNLDIDVLTKQDNEVLKRLLENDTFNIFPGSSEEDWIPKCKKKIIQSIHKINKDQIICFGNTAFDHGVSCFKWQKKKNNRRKLSVFSVIPDSERSHFENKGIKTHSKQKLLKVKSLYIKSYWHYTVANKENVVTIDYFRCNGKYSTVHQPST